MTDGILAFVRARLDEREQRARAAITKGDGTWRVEHRADGCEPGCDCRVVDGADIMIYDEGGHDGDHAEHIAYHDPQWVLADVAAKRALVSEHTGVPEESYRAVGGHTETVPIHCVCQDDGGCIQGAWPCQPIRLLASIDRAHPDWKPEWAPALETGS